MPRGLCGGSKYTNKAQSLDYERISLVIAPRLQQKKHPGEPSLPALFPMHSYSCAPLRCADLNHVFTFFLMQPQGQY